MYYVIPFIFIIHILPFHIINNLKHSLYCSNWLNKAKAIENFLFIGFFFRFGKKLFKKSFASPLSPQGMLILGLILSSYKLKYEREKNLSLKKITVNDKLIEEDITDTKDDDQIKISK